MGYGISLTLKVLDKETFLAHKRDYQLKYPDKEDKKDSGYNEDGDIYLFYGHLRKVLVSKGDVIDDISKPIALSGVSGVQSGGTCAPHVHFEIRDASKKRCNPGYYVYYKSYDDQSQIERDIQIKTAQNGKINEFGGKE
ncbi:M23 family metallopeptidase [Chryseobacterium echinoideorum]|uniref:M23 family metallopeptidase n=1 Tax=Chryseobacterium echinoideorum TaxID=1549648 RepID=UPI0016289F17|nr:M23 family metallopeptidase [Chryseobacterium echinoideorum]